MNSHTSIYESATKQKKSSKKKFRKNPNYVLLIKRIAAQLKKRINFPSCKIIKIYQPYRTLILRIAKAIKLTAKNMNFWNNNNNSNNMIKESTNKEREKNGIGLMTKEPIYKYDLTKLSAEDEENIKALLNINDSNSNVNFMNEFEDYLGNNNIEILKETKLPTFKDAKKRYLLTNINFWKKYINFICLKFKNDISFFIIVNLIDEFYRWINNQNDSNIFMKLIIQKIEFLFEQNQINDFLLTHKLKNLDDLFAKYQILGNQNETQLELKLSENCQCPTCQDLKEKDYNKESIKFPESKKKSKDLKITDYYTYSIKMRPSKIRTTKKKLNVNNEDQKILDFFNYTQVKQKKAKKNKKEKPKSKSRSKSKKSHKNKSEKNSTNDKVKEIFDLLNLESDK